MKFPLLLAHGELLIPIIFIGLPAALLGLVFLILTAIFHFRRKTSPPGRKVKIFGGLTVLMGVITLCSPSMLPLVDWVFLHLVPDTAIGRADKTVRQKDPTVIAAEKIPALIKKLPDYVGFGYSGAAYYQGRLYVSSNIGLLTLKDGQPESLLQWTSDDAVIEGPWFDGANRLLWAQSANDGSLLRFDGLHWTRLPLPEPPAGYTRGDMLDGFSGRSTPRFFWMMGGNCVWRWEPGSSSWSVEALPALPAGSAVRSFFNWDDRKAFVVRDGYQMGIEAGNNPATVHILDQTWRKFPGVDFDARESVQTEHSGFLRANDGRLFEVTLENMTRLETPGPCEAITITTKGALLASFGPAGVFERKDARWEKRAESPFGPAEGEHWAHLAESDGEIALVTSQVPQMIPGTDKFVHSGTAGIWITVNGRFKRVDSGK